MKKTKLNVSEDQLFDFLRWCQRHTGWEREKTAYLMKLVDEYIENDLGPPTLENELSRTELLHLILKIYAEKVDVGTSYGEFKSTAVKKVQERFNEKYPKCVF